MPYILQEDRSRLWEDGKYTGEQIKTAGELNYTLTMTYLYGGIKYTSDLITEVNRIIMEYYEKSDKRYQDINNIIGALAGSNLEYERRFSVIKGDAGDVDYVTNIVIKNFYREIAGPYENLAKTKNGDIV